MKRDMDLIRKILLKVESEPNGFAPHGLDIPDRTEEEIQYHMWLIGDAGLARVVDVTSHDSHSPAASIVSLTWAGHEFLDSARQNRIWEQAKEAIVKIGGSAPIQIWTALLTEYIKRQLFP